MTRVTATPEASSEANSEEPNERPDELLAYTVRTPEMVEFAYPLAGPGSRFLAWLVDGLVVIAIYVALIVVAFLTCLTAAMLRSIDSALLIYALAMFIAFLVRTFYSIFFELRWNGQTPGKRALGLRVLGENGVRMSFSQCFVRNLLRFVDSMPILCYAIGVTSMMVTRHSQRVGDLVARTVVVRELRRPLPEQLRLPQARYNSLLQDPNFAARCGRVLKPEERELLVEVAQRRDELSLAARSEIFGALAQHFRKRLQGHLGRDPGDQHLSDEKWILNLTQALLAGERQSFKA